MAVDQGPYFDAIDEQRRAARDKARQKPNVESASGRRLERLAGAVSALAAVGVLYLGASAVPSWRDLRTPLEERYLPFYSPGDCAPGWDAPKVDPIKLSHGMRVIFSSVVEQDNKNKSSLTQPKPSTKAAYAERDIDNLRAQLESYTFAGTGVEMLDETVEVACHAKTGGYMASKAMMEAAPFINDAGYSIDMMTGAVTTPVN
jgi:hypothetical protein